MLHVMQFFYGVVWPIVDGQQGLYTGFQLDADSVTASFS